MMITHFASLEVDEACRTPAPFFGWI